MSHLTTVDTVSGIEEMLRRANLKNGVEPIFVDGKFVGLKIGLLRIGSETGCLILRKETPL